MLTPELRTAIAEVQQADVRCQELEVQRLAAVDELNRSLVELGNLMQAKATLPTPQL